MSRTASDFRTASKESHKAFQKKHKVKITYDQFKKVIYYFNSLLVDYLLETGERIKMPFGLGTITINKFKPRKIRHRKEDGAEYPGYKIDFKRTKEEGKTIYHLNHHTDGYRYYWMWSWNTAKFKLSEVWKFEMCRVNSRLLVKLLKQPNSKYKDIYREYKTKRGR